MTRAGLRVKAPAVLLCLAVAVGDSALESSGTSAISAGCRIGTVSLNAAFVRKSNLGKVLANCCSRTLGGSFPASPDATCRRANHRPPQLRRIGI